MSPTPIQHKTEITNNLNKDLKTNRVSHSIKKTSSSSTLLPSNKQHQQQRQPVIIYTHSPKIIETHPKDFKALVQKLTGFSHDCSEERDMEANPISNCNLPLQLPLQLPPQDVAVEEAMEVKYPKNETSSVITEENSCGYSSMGEVKSCFMEAPPLMPYMRGLQLYEPNSMELMCPSNPFFEPSGTLPFPMRLEGMNKY